MKNSGSSSFCLNIVKPGLEQSGELLIFALAIKTYSFMETNNIFNLKENDYERFEEYCKRVR